MHSEEQRIYHRYEFELPVSFQGSTGEARGHLVNVSAGGCFVVSDSVPSTGKRLKLSVRAGATEEPVLLDVQVAWAGPESPGNRVDAGFGGFWLYAYSQCSAEHLERFLESVLGITKAATRSTTGDGGTPMHVYRFPVMYDGLQEHSFSEDLSGG
jgi:hypothetical protein